MHGLNHSVIMGKCPSCLIYEERVARLEDELALAKGENIATELNMAQVVGERNTAQAAKAAKAAALRRYGLHEDGCLGRIKKGCICGLDAALSDGGEGVVKRVFGEVDPAVATEPAVRGVLKETDRRIKEEVAAADRGAGEGCRYCNRPPDGPMLAGIGHGPCIIRRLRELLDPDWEPGCGYEPLALGTLGALDALEAPVEAQKECGGD